MPVKVRWKRRPELEVDHGSCLGHDEAPRVGDEVVDRQTGERMLLTGVRHRNGAYVVQYRLLSTVEQPWNPARHVVEKPTRRDNNEIFRISEDQASSTPVILAKNLVIRQE